VRFENASAVARFIVKADDGRSIARFYAETSPFVRVQDSAEKIQLQLTCRGKPDGEDFPAVKSLMNVFHEVIVSAFADFTRPDMHEMWGRKG
jgi:hypothetical protein